MMITNEFESIYNCSEGLTCGEGIMNLSTSTNLIPLNHLYKMNFTFLDVVIRNISLSELINSI